MAGKCSWRGRDILEGKKLIPQWRLNDGRGINLKKVFAEPRALDFILWAHGALAIPYLEKGALTSGGRGHGRNKFSKAISLVLPFG